MFGAWESAFDLTRELPIAKTKLVGFLHPDLDGAVVAAEWFVRNALVGGEEKCHSTSGDLSVVIEEDFDLPASVAAGAVEWDVIGISTVDAAAPCIADYHSC